MRFRVIFETVRRAPWSFFKVVPPGRASRNNPPNRAARFVINDYRRSTDSHELVNNLMWEPLEARRQLNQVTLLYKVNNGYMNINLPPDIKPSRRETNANSMPIVIHHLFVLSVYGTDSLTIQLQLKAYLSLRKWQ